jgi:hypothetical protein
MKTTNFKATYIDGTKYTWSFYRDGKYWYLKDYTGYVRTLEKTWADSVPIIHTILGNYNMDTKLS